MSGREVPRRIRGEEIGVPVIALTAGPRGDGFGSPDGADDHLANPFLPGELLTRVRVRLGGGHPDDDVVRAGGMLLVAEAPRPRRAREGRGAVPHGRV